jgi:hypothetical protein
MCKCLFLAYRPLRDYTVGGGVCLMKERLIITPELNAQMHACARDFRKTPTPSEGILWQALCNRQIAGFKFRRQYLLLSPSPLEGRPCKGLGVGLGVRGTPQEPIQ